MFTTNKNCNFEKNELSNELHHNNQNVISSGKLFATYEYIKNSHTEGNKRSNDQKETLVNQEVPCEKKQKSTKSVSFQTNEEKSDLPSSVYFGVKSYLHHFYEPISISEAFMKGDDFEFYVEPKTRNGYLHCSECSKLVIVIIIIGLYTAGVLSMFIMPEEIEQSISGQFVFAVTLVALFILTFILVWWLCSSILQSKHSEPIMYSAMMNSSIMKGEYNAENIYIRSIPLTGELKAVQFEN